MTQDGLIVYKVKTTSGYFFTTGNGRYGRFGDYQDGFDYCPKCAEAVCKFLRSLKLEPELEPVTVSHPCENPNHNLVARRNEQLETNEEAK
jgi:hypothetical protein